MKLRLPKRRAWRVAIYLGALLLIAIAIDMVVTDARRTIRPGYLTTRIVEPRLPDGSIDYAAAADQHFARGVTPQNNAAVPLLQVFGRAGLASNQPRDGVTTALRMPPLPDKGDYFVGHAEFMRIHKPSQAASGSIEWEMPREFTYGADTTPEIAEWARANDAALTRIVEATRRPRFFIPLVAGYRPQTLVEVQIPHVKLLKEAGHTLYVRAQARLNAGDSAGFIEDALALHRLARLMSHASTMVERVVAMSIEISAAQLDAQGAQSGKLSPQQAKQMIAALDALGELPTYLDTIDHGERWLGLDVIQVLAKLPPTEAGRLLNGIQGRHTYPAWTFRFLPIPYERTAREMNQAYDGMITASNQRTYPERRAALNLWSAEVERGVQQGAYLNLLSADWAISLLLPALDRATVRIEKARMQYHLARVALALSAFKAERGAYPAALAELSPAFLTTVSIDSFVERPLVYERASDGYRLRSAGPDMKDDDGSGDDLLIEAGVNRGGTTATTKTSSSGPARS
jgi:hypothetical protein